MKVIFEKWWNKEKKYIGLINYKEDWDKPDFWIHENGGRKGRDKCFNLNIHIGYLVFSYANFNS